MKKLVLLLCLCIILVSCTNTVQETSSAISSEFISSEEVSSEISYPALTNELTGIIDVISNEFKMRDLVNADEMVIENITKIKPEMYEKFAGKISYALDNVDTIFLFYASNSSDSENLIDLLEKAKEDYLKIYFGELKEDVEKSLILSKDGYVLWIIADDTSKAEEIILPLLIQPTDEEA